VVQPLQQEHRDQGCPNLDAQRVFAGADKAPHSQVLLQCLEKELNLPAFLVDGGDGRSPKIHVVGQQDDFTLIFPIPDDDPPQITRTLLLGLRAGQHDHLIGQDVAARRDGESLNDLVDGVVLHPGHEVDPVLCPARKLLVIVIGAVDGHDGVWLQLQQSQRLRVMHLGFTDQDIRRQVVVMVQQDMGLDTPLGSAELGPREQAQAKADGGRVQRQ